jgi:hypothetical protein
LLVAAVAPAEDAQASRPQCGAWEAEYVVHANLQLTETPHGLGDGVYRVGPGKLVLRFETDDDAPNGTVHVQLVSYGMPEHLLIHSSFLFWSSVFTSNTETRVAAKGCEVAAEGSLDGRTLEWSTPLREWHTDGVAQCNGSLCGKGGGPPPGQTPVHLSPHSVKFGRFAFSPDLTTFTMKRTFISRYESPKLAAAIAMSGREIAKKCVEIDPCS